MKLSLVESRLFGRICYGYRRDKQWNEMFISIFKFLDIHFVIQHDQELNDTDISTIKSLISDLNKQYQSLKDAQNTTRI